VNRSLTVSIMSELCKLALTRMKQNKSNIRSRITHVHLYEMMQIDISKIEPNINSFREERQTQFQLYECKFRTCYRSVQFYVVYGRVIRPS
jgi:hypothetical protein